MLNVPSQTLTPRNGSRISAAYFPHGRRLTPLYFVLPTCFVLLFVLRLVVVFLGTFEMAVVVVVVVVVVRCTELTGRCLTARLTRRRSDASSDSVSDVSVASGSLQMMRKVRGFTIGKIRGGKLTASVGFNKKEEDGRRRIKEAALIESV